MGTAYLIYKSMPPELILILLIPMGTVKMIQ